MEFRNGSFRVLSPDSWRVANKDIVDAIGHQKVTKRFRRRQVFGTRVVDRLQGFDTKRQQVYVNTFPHTNDACIRRQALQYSINRIQSCQCPSMSKRGARVEHRAPQVEIERAGSR